MYKHASRNLQRRLKVIEVRPSAAAYICEDDLIQSAANMGEAECEEERRKLMTEKARLENELLGAKATRDGAEIRRIGARLQTVGSRLGLLKKRLHQLTSQRTLDAFHDAAREILPATVLGDIYRRQKELIAAAKGGSWHD